MGNGQRPDEILILLDIVQEKGTHRVQKKRREERKRKRKKRGLEKEGRFDSEFLSCLHLIITKV